MNRWVVVLIAIATGCGRIAFEPVDDGGLAGTPLRALSAGGNHTCALLEDSSVWCWGANRIGELGDGTMVGRDSAARVDLPPVASIIAGDSVTCALTESGDQYCWGSLNEPNGGVVATVPKLLRSNATAMAAQSVSVCGIVGGAVLCNGQPFVNVGDFGTDNVEVAVGRRVVCSRKLAGTVWCAGQGFQGELGDAGATLSVLDAIQIPGVANAVALAIDNYYLCARLADRSVTCWGNDNNVYRIPTVIGTADDVSLGSGVRCLRDGDDVQCLGANFSGSLGDGTAVPSMTYHDNQTASGLHELSFGFAHGCGLDADARGWCWGSNADGQLGLAELGLQPAPVPIAGFTATALSGHSFGGHVCAVAAGEAWCWGLNSSGQIGDGSSLHVTAPTPIGSFVEVAAGSDHTCGRRSDGTVACWGANDSGQLGNGTTTPSRVPVAASIGNVTRVFAGYGRTFAIVADGSLWGWGANSNGWLGTGDLLPHSSPVLITATPTLDVSVALQHTCLVTTANAVACWGNNGSGQLGLAGTPTEALTPTAVSVPRPVDRIAVGSTHSCARATDGGLICWGRGIDGQLGPSVTNIQITPADILGAGSVVGLTAANFGTCVINSAVTCTGQFAGRTTTTFEAVDFGATATSEVVATLGTLCARAVDGTVSCVGDNTNGTTGIGVAVFHIDRVPQLP